MADISKITLPSGSTYDIKDATARQSISDIQSSITGAMHYRGVTTTALTDGSTTATITIDDASVTFGASDAGSVVIYSEKEYVWNGTKWQEFGSTGSLKALAFKDSASGSFTPGGSVTVVTKTSSVKDFNVLSKTPTQASPKTYTPAGSVSVTTNTTTNKTAVVGTTSGTATYTPAGSVSITNKTFSTEHAPIVEYGSGEITYTPSGTVTPNVTLNTTTVNSITGVGSLPSLTTTVENENLTIGWSAGTLPTKGSDTTVATSIKSQTATFSGTGKKLYAPYQLPSAYNATFNGTGVRLITGNIAVPASYSATFTGADTTLYGSVNVPNTYSATFAGTEDTVTVS